MSSTPGSRTPGEAPRTEQSLEATGVALDAMGTTDIGSVVAEEAEVEEVYVVSTAQDFDFNIEFNGNDVFGSEQSPDNAEESFTPDQNTRAAGTGDATVTIDVSGAGTGGATATVIVLVEYRND